MFSEISGPTLPYIKTRVNSNFEEIGRALFSRSVGFFIGAIFGGVLGDRFARYTDIIMAGGLILAAVGTTLAPWCSQLALLGIMFCLDGIGKGILAAGMLTLCVGLVKETWNKSCTQSGDASFVSK